MFSTRRVRITFETYMIVCLAPEGCELPLKHTWEGLMYMLKLIIADDEKWVRTTIRSVIPFEKLSLDLSCEAADGIEALELCRQHKPDIMLTDIMMPGLNGLELIREVKHLLPDLRIVVISGYNDFEYAKTAMKYGITDYLLKPIDEEELTQVLERISCELREMRRLEIEKHAEKERYMTALPVVCESFLNQMISYNSMTCEKMRSELQRYGIEFTRNSFTICVTTSDENLRSEGNRKAMEYLKTLVKRSMKRTAKAVTFSLEQDKTILVSIINSENESENIKKSFDFCNRQMQKKFRVSISSGVSESTHQLCMLQDLYLKAVEALAVRFWTGPGSLAIYKPQLLTEDLKLTLSEDMLNKITLNFKLSNVQTAISFVDNISASLENCRVKPSLVREFFWQFLQSIIILLNIQLPFIRQETVVTGVKPYERLQDTIFFHSLIECVKELLQHCYDFYHDKNPLDNNNMIENAKKIIESNFAGDISLEQVAKHVHLSPAYLSELFKKETGMSFIDYKTIIRIEHAKELLLTLNMNISEVSAKIGYTDPKYFSKLFKKITGKTIYEYKKEVRQEEIQRQV